jgi:uncharacterized LabA/DUF88 family protein
MEMSGQHATEDRVLVLIDGSSLFRAAAILGIEIDYAKLLPVLVGTRQLVYTYFYTGVSTGNLKQKSFLSWMKNHGYRIISKELTLSPTGDRSADLSVEMAVDMLRLAAHVDVIVLVSHDQNLLYAISNLDAQRVRLELVGLRHLVNPEMIETIDYFRDLAILQAQIKRAN